ncbi:hypothetical protein ACJ41O_001451 [Fusarium nematophilum]
MLTKLALTLSALAACGADAGIIEPKKYYKHKCDPVNLVENPSFDDENSSGVVDGSPWVFTSPPQVRLSDDPPIALTGDYYALFYITENGQTPVLSQDITGIVAGYEYQVTYNYAVHKGYPTNYNNCFFYVHVDEQGESIDQIVDAEKDVYVTKQFSFIATGDGTLSIELQCDGTPIDGPLKVAVDDVSIYKVDPKCPAPVDVVDEVDEVDELEG